ncbi:MAG: hypothetical protein JNL66_12765 [Alphaproteobacteria bacterium]|nr:hypothetical protein [Alphaproteobacteria bacterium]
MKKAGVVERRLFKTDSRATELGIRRPGFKRDPAARRAARGYFDLPPFGGSEKAEDTDPGFALAAAFFLGFLGSLPERI